MVGFPRWFSKYVCWLFLLCTTLSTFFGGCSEFGYFFGLLLQQLEQTFSCSNRFTTDSAYYFVGRSLQKYFGKNTDDYLYKISSIEFWYGVWIMYKYESSATMLDTITIR